MGEIVGLTPSFPGLNIRFPDLNSRGQIFSSASLEASSRRYPLQESLSVEDGLGLQVGVVGGAHHRAAGDLVEAD